MKENYFKRFAKANIGLLISSSMFGNFRVYQLKILEDKYSKAVITGSSLDEVFLRAIEFLKIKYKVII